MPVKVTVVNEEGLIVLDTLIRPMIDGIDESTPIHTIQNYKSQEAIHGIKKKWLNDAPSMQAVTDHISEVCGKKQITHSVKEVPKSDDKIAKTVSETTNAPTITAKQD